MILELGYAAHVDEFSQFVWNIRRAPYDVRNDYLGVHCVTVTAWNPLTSHFPLPPAARHHTCDNTTTTNTITITIENTTTSTNTDTNTIIQVQLQTLTLTLKSTLTLPLT